MIMSLKKRCTVNAVCSLAAGALLYYLFRPRTLFLSWFPFSGPFARISFPGGMIIRCYLPDSLWCYAFSFSLFRLHLPSGKKAAYLSLLSFVFGCVWEFLQSIGVVSGTGDLLDCVAYGVGSLAALCIYFFIRRSHT